MFRTKLAEVGAHMGQQGKEADNWTRELPSSADPGPGAFEVSTTCKSPEKRRKMERGKKTPVLTEFKSVNCKVFIKG